MMRWALILVGLTAAAQAQPEFSRDEPKLGMVLGYRDGRLLVGRGVDGPGVAVRLLVEDREGKTIRDEKVGPDAGVDGRFRVTTGGLTADGAVIASGVATQPQRRIESLLLLGAGEKLVPLGDFSCSAVAAARLDGAWCLGYYLYPQERDAGQQHLLYRVGADGKVAAFYPLPAKADQRTAEGLSRFPGLGLPALWANGDGSVWAWLPGDRKMVRFRAESGRLEVWEVPVPKGGTAGVSVTVTSGNRVMALLPLSQDGWRVAPGPSPVFGLFELKASAKLWERVEGLPDFKRGVKLIGSDASSVVVSNRETKKLEWYAVGGG